MIYFNILKALLITSAVINAISFVALSLFVAIVIPAYSMWFYRWQYRVNNTYEQVQMERTDLHAVTRHMIRFLQGQESNLQIEVMVDGQLRYFFSELEIRHMEDVSTLFRAAHISAYVFTSLFVVSLGIIIIWGRRRIKYLFRSWQIASATILSLILLLGVIIAINWYRAWDIFHHIFFRNDYWILDPSTDLLINIVPYNFFITVSIMVGSVFVFFLTAMLTGSTIALFSMKKHWRRTRQ